MQTEILSGFTFFSKKMKIFSEIAISLDNHHTFSHEKISIKPPF